MLLLLGPRTLDHSHFGLFTVIPWPSQVCSGPRAFAHPSSSVWQARALYLYMTSAFICFRSCSTIIFFVTSSLIIPLPFEIVTPELFLLFPLLCFFFLSTCHWHQIYFTYLFLSSPFLPLLKCKLHKSREFCLFSFLLSPPCLEQCLEYFMEVGLNISLLKELSLNTIILDGWTMCVMMI